MQRLQAEQEQQAALLGVQADSQAEWAEARQDQTEAASRVR